MTPLLVAPPELPELEPPLVDPLPPDDPELPLEEEELFDGVPDDEQAAVHPAATRVHERAAPTRFASFGMGVRRRIASSVPPMCRLFPGRQMV
jgi:hypothetical protein